MRYLIFTLLMALTACSSPEPTLLTQPVPTRDRMRLKAGEIRQSDQCRLLYLDEDATVVQQTALTLCATRQHYINKIHEIDEALAEHELVERLLSSR